MKSKLQTRRTQLAFTVLCLPFVSALSLLHPLRRKPATRAKRMPARTAFSVSTSSSHPPNLQRAESFEIKITWRQVALKICQVHSKKLYLSHIQKLSRRLQQLFYAAAMPRGRLAGSRNISQSKIAAIIILRIKNSVPFVKITTNLGISNITIG